MIVRRLDDGRFKLVGQAYFYGFMTGESLLDELSKQEPEELVLIQVLTTYFAISTNEGVSTLPTSRELFKHATYFL